MSIKIDRVGKININNVGCKMKIISYRDANDIDVQFETGYIRTGLKYKNFKNGSIDSIDYSKRVGETRTNSYGSKITIIEYIDNRNVIVQFDNGYISKTNWDHFKKGSIRSPYCKSFCGIGYLGEGEFTCDNIWYEFWRAMIERVNIKNDGYHRTYENVSICEEWYNYQVFAKWAKDNYYELGSEKINLDKDILVKGNHIYSPNTCSFVPFIINVLFVKSDRARGKFPIGVYWHKRDKIFRAQCSSTNSNGHRYNNQLGNFQTPESAFYAYKEFKEQYIKQIADEYRDKYPQFPIRLYDAMYAYEVEITD